MFSRLLRVNYRISTNSNFTAQKNTTHRSLHLACKNLRKDLIFCNSKDHEFYTSKLSVACIRYLSQNRTDNSSLNESREINAQTTDLSEIEDLTSKIPDPPVPISSEIVEALLSEPSLQSLGIGSWYPHGLLQQWMNFLHISADFPWWGSIMFTTVCIRIIILPIVIRLQRYTARMQNLQPEIQYYQQEIAEARKMGDQLEVLRVTVEMRDFMKKHGVDPLKNVALPLLQTPIFLSMFWALRGMVKLPIDSMKYGGVWWFQDLTIADPYYILPLITSITLSLTLELGTDTLRLETLGMLKHVIRFCPIVMFPLIMNFEGAILCYWVSANFCSLIQVAILRSPKVRTYFDIEKLIKHDKKKLPISNRKFIDGFKTTWSDMRTARQLNSRVAYDETVFIKAGRGPVPKTYKYDPTKVTVNTLLSKRRD